MRAKLLKSTSSPGRFYDPFLHWNHFKTAEKSIGTYRDG
jgi:hypothetical protein